MSTPESAESLAGWDGEDVDVRKLAARVRTLGDCLRARQLRLCTVESCTGGGIAQAITDIAGSSDWFECGWVTYSNAAKHYMVDVPIDRIETHGAVSEEVARAMVEGGLARSTADLALAVTGIAGPAGGTPEKPVGMVCFGWQLRGQRARVQTRYFSGTRQAVRFQATLYALEGLLTHELA